MLTTSSMMMSIIKRLTQIEVHIEQIENQLYENMMKEMGQQN